MYINTGYLNESDIDVEDQREALTVTGCGIYRLVKQPVMETVRPRGRKDFQLLYVSKGRAFFSFDEETPMMEVPSGGVFLYRPGEAQRYSYYLEDQPEVCWVHFTGREAAGLLDAIGFQNRDMLSCRAGTECEKLFLRMIRELQLKRPCFETFLPLYLRELFAEIDRGRQEGNLVPSANRSAMEKAVHDFNEAFSGEICIEDYAKEHHMSVCWFIRCFRAYMGMAPMQYITSVRINRARELLRSTDYSVAEIGALVGYDNPLYFSRIFRKQTGFSPSEYRKSGRS